MTMDQLIESCEKSEQYPQNLVHHEFIRHKLHSYLDRLRRQAARLFNEKHAAIDVLEYDDTAREVQTSCVTSLVGLKELLRKDFDRQPSGSRCCFVFLHAPHSRAALRISYPMLNFLFSYHQVMPEFLDFLFPFGNQQSAQDAHFSGFKEDSHIGANYTGLKIRELGRSGREIRLCYNLRSVEPSSSSPTLPWSIRQTAVYHSFDLETFASLWINVKGNKLMKNRVIEASEAMESQRPICSSNSFAASLQTHALFCDWSGEHWRWYINHLEEMLRAASLKTLIAPISQLPTHQQASSPKHLNPENYSEPFPKPHVSKLEQKSGSPNIGSESPSTAYESRASTLIDSPEGNEEQGKYQSHKAWLYASEKRCMSPDETLHLASNKAHSNRQVCPQLAHSSISNRTGDTQASRNTSSPETTSSSERMLPPELPPPLEDVTHADPNNIRGSGQNNKLESFTIGELQNLQYIEEKIREVPLELKLNLNVYRQLRDHYRRIVSHADFPTEIRSSCTNDILTFEKKIQELEKDIYAQQLRTDTLLSVVSDRKRLFHDILQYRSMKASELFAQKAQISAEKMEAMTSSMREITRKTNKETVSMRVITSVTLFFLPGTFVATFMSTDIIKFPNNRREFQLRSLHIYLAICLPMMALTFIAWYVVYRLAKKRDEMFDLSGLAERHSEMV